MNRNKLGFTLLELVTVVAIVGVLVAVAVPQLSQWLENNRLKSSCMGIRSSMLLARSTAIEKKTLVVIEFSTGINGGYTVFVDDGDLNHAAGEEVVRSGKMPSGIRVTDTEFPDDKACYNAMGFPVNTGTVFVSNAGATKVQRVILAAAGSVKVEAGS